MMSAFDDPLFCPKCDEDELWLQRFKGGFKVACYNCGWNSGIVIWAGGADIDDAIAAAVAAARAPAPKGGAGEPLGPGAESEAE